MIYRTKKKSLLTREQVVQYRGSEISESLQPNQMYNVYRPKEEIAKAVDQIKGLPIIMDHKWIDRGRIMSGEIKAVGSVDHDVEINDRGEVLSSLNLYDKAALDQKRGLSFGYTYRIDPTAGEFNGQKYDFIQRDLNFNHLSIVPVGRAGLDARAMDNLTAFDHALEIELSSFDQIDDKKDLTNKEASDIKQHLNTDEGEKMDLDSLKKALDEQKTITADLTQKIEILVERAKAQDEEIKAKDEQLKKEIEESEKKAEELLKQKLQEKQALDEFIATAKPHVGDFVALDMAEASKFVADHLKVENKGKEFLEGVMLAKAQQTSTKTKAEDSKTDAIDFSHTAV